MGAFALCFPPYVAAMCIKCAKVAVGGTILFPLYWDIFALSLESVGGWEKRFCVFYSALRCEES
jgi:hypothetical protein